VKKKDFFIDWRMSERGVNVVRAQVVF